MEPKKDWTADELEKEYVNKMRAVTVSTDIKIDGKQKILDMSKEDFEAEFADTCLARSGLESLKRNAQICLADISH